MGFCTQCGAVLPDETNFCTACGAKRETASGTSSPSPVENRAADAPIRLTEEKPAVMATPAAISPTVADAVPMTAPVDSAEPAPVSAEPPKASVVYASAMPDETSAVSAAVLDGGPTQEPASAATFPVSPAASVPKTPCPAPAANAVSAAAPIGSFVPPAVQAPSTWTYPPAASSAVGDPPAEDSRYAVLSVNSFLATFLLMCIPGIGLLLTIIWACGGSRYQNRRNLARASLLFVLILTFLFCCAALVSFLVFREWLAEHPGELQRWADELTHLFR